jgi:hypothetical protein
MKSEFLTDERSKRLSALLEGKQVQGRPARREDKQAAGRQGHDLTRDMIEKIRSRDLKRYEAEG